MSQAREEHASSRDSEGIAAGSQRISIGTSSNPLFPCCFPIRQRFGERLQSCLQRASGLTAFGFTMHETMSGHHRFVPGRGPEGRWPFVFEVDWGPQQLSDWVEAGWRGPWVSSLEGVVEVGGLCERTRCTGTLALDYVREGELRYGFDFAINAGEGHACSSDSEGISVRASSVPESERLSIGAGGYRFLGSKVGIRPWNLGTSHTTCCGVLLDSNGVLISRSTTHFRLATLGSFLSSLRFHRASCSASAEPRPG